MLVIDANTGQQLIEGCNYRNVNGYFGVIKIKPGWFTASIVIRKSGQTLFKEIPLQVRWTHPKYFLKHVAFLPS